jgi:hypothetical protein
MDKELWDGKQSEDRPWSPIGELNIFRFSVQCHHIRTFLDS